MLRSVVRLASRPLFRTTLPLVAPVSGGNRRGIMNGRSTLLRQPPEDPNKAPLENAIEITELGVLGPDMFTNTREAWHPPGARGIFGGVAIAQCIAAGQRTVPRDFSIHSCHCYFLLAGSNSIPITYHVERVRDGRSYATRTVQARQRGACIFTTTMSFTRTAASEGRPSVRHALGSSGGVPPAPDDDSGAAAGGDGGGNEAIELTGVVVTEGPPAERKCRHWVRARGRIGGGEDAHVAALAYMTDWFFLGTIPRVHGLFRPAPSSSEPENPDGSSSSSSAEGGGGGGKGEEAAPPRPPQIGMMVSLDHSIYFHEPAAIRADEWMFTEMDSPWAGNGRGVVTQRVFSKEGVLLATCMQEGVMRLKDEKDDAKAAKL